jgi:hypothetical protein
MNAILRILHTDRRDPNVIQCDYGAMVQECHSAAVLDLGRYGIQHTAFSYKK